MSKINKFNEFISSEESVLLKMIRRKERVIHHQIWKKYLIVNLIKMLFLLVRN